MRKVQGDNLVLWSVKVRLEVEHGAIVGDVLVARVEIVHDLDKAQPL